VGDRNFYKYCFGKKLTVPTKRLERKTDHGILSWLKRVREVLWKRNNVERTDFTNKSLNIDKINILLKQKEYENILDN